MLDIVGIALARGIGSLFLLTWVLPAGIIFLAYLIYIIIKVIQELRK